MTYQLLERRETSDVFADLEALLDKVSPYYKARVEDYVTAQQRAVIDAIALNWDPILSHDLSVKAGVEITTVSSHLNRLKRDGFIEEVATSGARAGYQIAERFLNIWYLMRHSTRRTRQRLAGLAAFFARLYSAPELERMAGLARDEEASSHWSPHYREGLLEAARLYGGTPVGEEPSAATASDGVIEGILARARGWTNKEAARLLAHALGLVSRGEHQLALERWEEILSRYGASPDTSLKELAGMAIFGRGVALSALGRYEEAIIAYDALDARFGGEHAFHKPIAVALFSKGVMLDQLGESEEAIAVYDDVVARFSAASEPAQRERVAMALVHKGVTLGRLGRAKEEIAVYDDAVARFGAASEPALCEWVAKALCNKGFALGELERPKEAIAVYDDVVARFGAASETALREPVAMALVNKGVTLGRLGRPEEEIAAYDDAVGRFGAASEPALREHVGRAVINKGSRFAEQGRSEEAIAVYEDLVARFGAASEPALRERVARALVDKGVTLGRLGRLEEAIAVYDDVVSRFGAASEPALRGQVAMALVSKGDALAKLGRPEDQIAVYDEVVARFGDDSELAVRRPVAWGLVRRGNLALDRRGGFGVAEGAYRRAVALELGVARGARQSGMAADRDWAHGRSVDASWRVVHAAAGRARVARCRAKSRQGQLRRRDGASGKGVRARARVRRLGFFRRPAPPSLPCRSPRPWRAADRLVRVERLRRQIRTHPRRLRRLRQGRALPARRQPRSPPPSAGFLRQALGAKAAYRRRAGSEAEARAEAKSVGQKINSAEPRKRAKAKSRLLYFLKIEFVLSINCEKLDLDQARQMDRKRGGSENGRREKARKNIGRKSLKSHETAKSDISRPNDFNSLRGVWRNKIASQAKLIVSQAKSPDSLSELRRHRTHRDSGR